MITTNVDHQFQKAGFDHERLFYMQGDYGLFQQEDPAKQITYDNEDWVVKAMEAQGFQKDENGEFLQLAADPENIRMEIPADLIPMSEDHRPLAMNLRIDSRFVQDDGWHEAFERYDRFLREHRKDHVLYLELGVGYNTPGIIKYPFLQMTASNPNARYAVINNSGIFCPDEIRNQSICIEADLASAIEALDQMTEAEIR